MAQNFQIDPADITDADALSPQQIRDLAKDPDFIKFRKRIGQLVGKITDLIDENYSRYNCSFVFAVTFAAAPDSAITNTAVTGRTDSVSRAVRRLLKTDDVAPIVALEALMHIKTSQN